MSEKKPRIGGRKKGTPNKITNEAREAIALFVDNNAHRLEGWLEQVAEKNPEKAFQLFQSVIEYHIPKLARTEQTLTGADGGPVEHSIKVSFDESDSR
jgi:hypothetical protein